MCTSKNTTGKLSSAKHKIQKMAAPSEKPAVGAPAEPSDLNAFLMKQCEVKDQQIRELKAGAQQLADIAGEMTMMELAKQESELLGRDRDAYVVVADGEIVIVVFDLARADSVAGRLREAADLVWERGGAKIPGAARRDFEVKVVKVRTGQLTMSAGLRLATSWHTYSANKKN